MDNAFDKFMFHVAETLEPYLPNIVFAGGTASYLYHKHPLARGLGFSPVKTVDVDIVTWNPLLLPEVEGNVVFGSASPSDQNEVSQLLLSHGFESTFNQTISGEDCIQRFYPQDESLRNENFHIEFLCPLKGSEVDKKTGRRKIAEDIQDNLTAQTLRYIDLLLLDPMSISIACPAGTGKQMSIQIPHPVTYMAQKTLIAPERMRQGNNKYEKDCYYIFEAGALFRREHRNLTQSFSKIHSQCNAEQKKWLTRFFARAKVEFSSEKSDFTLALMSYTKLIARQISPSQVVAALKWALECASETSQNQEKDSHR